MSERYPVDSLIVALTGGIASGKSAVLARLAELGAGTLDADQVARDVVQPGTPALKAIAGAFGQKILTNEGTLDRPALRLLVFNDAQKRRQLEAILHPAIAEAAQAGLKALAVEAPYVVYAIPLLIETGQQHRFDRILLVDVPVETQLQRIMSRDNNDRETAMKIIQSQASREARLAIADDVIDNSGSLDFLQQQTDALHQTYLAMCR